MHSDKGVIGLSSRFVAVIYLALAVSCLSSSCLAETYPIVDTGQERCYDNRIEIRYPKRGEPFFGQDAQYRGNSPAYRDNGDGTISDLVTGLMWQKDPGPKKTFPEAVSGASACRVGQYDDWRLPSIKELYSLILFSGEDVNPFAADACELKPFINTDYFRFVYGDPDRGERIIDSQAATSTKYVSTTMNGNETMFGVNFADGRIKGYPAGRRRRGAGKYYVYYVRGNPDYGKNDFHDNGDGTVADRATGLCWAKVDSGQLKAGAKRDGKLNWEQALRWVEELEYAGHSDWRLPNAKELQSIVDYTRSPDTTNSAAIDPIFQSTPIRDGLGEVNYPFYWSSTTHKKRGDGRAACYIAFGRSQGWMQGRFGSAEYQLLDVHGAGSQRSDPKAGDPSEFPRGRGPQGDVIGIYNMVRAVRGGDVTFHQRGPELEPESESRRRGGPMEATRPVGPPAQQPGRGGGSRFLQRFDRNRDGKVTREEFGGPPPRFRNVDLDGDGTVTREEAAQADPPDPPEAGPRRPGGRSRRPGRPTQGPPRRGLGSAPGTNESRQRRPGPDGPRPNRPESEVRPQPNVPTRAADSDEQVRADATWSQLPPSFVFILADDMGWTGTSVQMDDQVPESKSDYYQTPNLENLAEEGLRFTQAYAPAPLCTPTRAAILTGKTPAALHVTTPGGGRSQVPRKLLTPPVPRIKIEDSETTIAEALKEVGYATAHLGKWHLGQNSSPGERGFDFHDGNTENGGPGRFQDPNPKDIFGITDRAVDFMRQQVQRNKPFYLQLSHYGVGSSVPQSALVVGQYKIIRDHESGSVQLFDLAEDLAESNDLARSLPEKAKKLEKLLDDRLGRANAQMTSVNPDYDPGTPVMRGRPGEPRDGGRRARGGWRAGDKPRRAFQPS